MEPEALAGTEIVCEPAHCRAPLTACKPLLVFHALA